MRVLNPDLEKEAAAKDQQLQQVRTGKLLVNAGVLRWGHCLLGSWKISIHGPCLLGLLMALGIYSSPVSFAAQYGDYEACMAARTVGRLRSGFLCDMGEQASINKRIRKMQ